MPKNMTKYSKKEAKYNMKSVIIFNLVLIIKIDRTRKSSCIIYIHGQLIL